KLAKAETLAEGLREAGPALDAKVMAEGMKELAALMEKMAAEDLLGKHADSDVMKGAKAGTLRPEQLKQLAEALRDAKLDLASQLARLHEAGLIDLETLKQCENGGKCQGEALAELLKQCQGKQSVSDLLNH